jgi:hypothetical protein
MVIRGKYLQKSGLIGVKLDNYGKWDKQSRTKTSTKMTKLYPKGTIRRIVKAHEPQHKLTKSTDVLVAPISNAC